MTSRIALFSLGFALTACGELSATPGQDAGPATTRRTCDSCQAVFEICERNECRIACDYTEAYPCPYETDRCLNSVCEHERTPSCADTPCNEDQVCVSGYCLAVTSVSCGTNPGACSLGQLCLGSPATCVSPPPCDRDGACRIGDLGAVCNTNGATRENLLDAAWAEVCLLGRCTSDAHCPSPLACREIGVEAPSLGRCL